MITHLIPHLITLPFSSGRRPRGHASGASASTLQPYGPLCDLPPKQRTLLRSYGGAPERSASAYCQQLFCRGLFAVLFSGTVPPLLSSLPPTPLSRHTALLASAPALSPGTPHSLFFFVGGSLRRRYGRP